MEKYFNAIFDLTKVPTRFFLLLSIVSSFILFVDQDFLNEKLFLVNVKEKYGWILGVVFILTTGLVLLNFTIWVFKPIKRKINFKKWNEKFAKRVSSFDRVEKSILREFILSGQKSIEMPIDNPSVSGLLDKNILLMNRQFGNSSIIMGMRVSLSINESVVEILQFKDIDLSDPPTLEELESAKNNRPEWTKQYF